LQPPDDPLAPPSGVFAEPWQATVLAMATALIRQGHFTQIDWAHALGAKLAEADKMGAPDTEDTYYNAALTALEQLIGQAGIPPADQATRKAAWEDAYRRTPHGAPVVLE
jgi:nitrile hydratase accessory protein